jgi:hypothetical protein
MMKILAALLCAAFVTGCATEEGYKQILNSWVGADVDQLVMSWGPPDRGYKLNSGGSVLEYGSQRTVTTGGYTTYKPVTTYQSGSVYGNYGGSALYSGSSTTYVPQTSPVYTYDYTCVTRFNVGENNKIVSWSYEGNDCRAVEE